MALRYWTLTGPGPKMVAQGLIRDGSSLGHRKGTTLKNYRVMRTAGWLAVAGLLGAAIVGPTGALATDLHQTPPITASELPSSCDGSEGITPGQVYWHFVLIDAEDAGAKLTATFQHAGVFASVAAYKVSGNATHFAVVTPTDDTLLAASTDIDGDKLNLSHVCYGTTTTTTGTTTTGTTTTGTTTTGTTTTGTTTTGTTTTGTTTTGTTTTGTTTTGTTTTGTTTTGTTTTGTTTTGTTTTGTTTTGTTTTGTTTTGTTTTGTTTTGTTTTGTTTTGTTTTGTTTTGTGTVGGVTGTPEPELTPPSTDTVSVTGGSSPAGGTWQLLLVAMAGLLAGVLLLTPGTTRKR